MTDQSSFGFALRAMIRTVAIWIGDLVVVWSRGGLGVPGQKLAEPSTVSQRQTLGYPESKCNPA
jgi:hypothetical protein